jgi:tetratricopeptide (TPR) repeat protein
VGRADFISVDDHEYVSGNQIVQSGLTWNGVRWAFTASHVANYHPLTWLSHMLDCQLFGPNPGWHHRVNLLLHAINSVLVFLVLRRMTGRDWCSAFVAGVFALHPQHVESVAWIAERKDMLCGLFWMLTLAAWVWYIERPTWWRYGLALLAFALGLLSKPMVVTLPFVLLLLDFWPLRRMSWFGHDPIRHRSLRLLFVEKLPFVALAVAGSIATMLAQSTGGAVVTLEDMPLWMRFGNMVVSYVGYVRKFLWPSDLAAFYPLLGPWPTARVIGAAAILIVLTAVVLLYMRRRPFLVTGWFWFLGTLVPVIGLVHVGNQAMADRYMYLPMIGLAVIVAWLAAEMQQHLRRAIPAAAICALLACAWVTRIDVGYWNNSEKLFTRALERTEPNVFSMHIIAVSMVQRSEYDGAVKMLEEAKKLQPGNPHIRRAYGYALRHAKRLDESQKQLTIALKIDPEDGRSWDAMAQLYADKKEWEKAADHFEVAAERRPDDFDIRMALAAAHRESGQRDAALDDLRIAQRLNPRLSQPWFLEGVLLLESNRPADAVAQLARAAMLSPNHAETQYHLGLALMQSGQGHSAVEPLMNAVQLSPTSPDPMIRLAWLLATHPDPRLRHGEEALYFAVRADELTGHKSPQALDALAAAQAERLQFDQAAQTALKASQLAKDSGNTELSSQIDQRIQGYRANRSTRDATLAGVDSDPILP